MGQRATRFEDLIAWQKARVVAREVNRATRDPAFRADRSLVSQMRRAATSVMSNLAEGFDRGGRNEFHRFIVMAKGSCAELRSHLYVALDDEILSEERFNELYLRAEEVSRILGGLRAAVSRQRPTAKGKRPE